ncbi:hypothetical protein D3C78_1254460 [compost metagenome]
MREHIVLERVGVVHRERPTARTGYPGHDQRSLRVVYQRLAAAADQVVDPTTNGQCSEVLALRVDGETAGEYLGIAYGRRAGRLAATYRQTLFIHRRIADGQHWRAGILADVDGQGRRVCVVVTILECVGEHVRCPDRDRGRGQRVAVLAIRAHGQVAVLARDREATRRVAVGAAIEADDLADRRVVRPLDVSPRTTGTARGTQPGDDVAGDRGEHPFDGAVRIVVGCRGIIADDHLEITGTNIPCGIRG